MDSRWVFKLKKDVQGNPERYKARLVVKGCAQIPGLDFDQTYAPVARLTTLRCLLAVINHENLQAEQLDVKNAFLQGFLKEELYMKQPEGMKESPGLVCKLNRALYGLKQASNAWNSRFDSFVKSAKFVQSTEDRCLYTKFENGHKLYLLLYVDDVILASDSPVMIKETKALLMNEFRMTDLGRLHHFLGIQITFSNGGLALSQSHFFRDVLERFDMSDCNPCKTPLDTKLPVELEGECIVDSKPYRQLVRCLMYGMLATRPDISMAVNFFSRFLSNATERQWRGLKRVLKYIKGTLHVSLNFDKTSSNYQLHGFADADWAGDTDRKSTSGFLFCLGNSLVQWSTQKQCTVALSTTEAEYIALASGVSELLWLLKLFKDLGVSFKNPPLLHEDNLSCIHSLSRVEHKKLKHIDVKFHFLKDLYNKRFFTICHVASVDQLADILTKGLPFETFDKFCKRLGVR